MSSKVRTTASPSKSSLSSIKDDNKKSANTGSSIRSSGNDKASAPIRGYDAPVTRDEPAKVRNYGPIDRLTDILHAPQQALIDEPEHEYQIGSITRGLLTINQDLNLLGEEIQRLEQTLRPHMPDHLYSELDDSNVAKSMGHTPSCMAATTPTIEAVCQLADKVLYLRRALAVIQNNVVAI